MNAVGAIMAARDAGIQLSVDGGDLVLEASAAPSSDVLGLLSRHKADIVLLLCPDGAGWSSEDWRAFFDERAGIAEFDGDLARTDADAQAFFCCVTEWLNRHPVGSSPDRCLACGENETAANPLLPYGTEDHGLAWLHSDCWRDWYDSRKTEAIAALVNMGIEKSAKFPNDFGKNGSQ
jgi:hypothetical protein